MSIRLTILMPFLVLSCLFGFTKTAAADDVYVNGRKVSGGALKNTVLDNVTVRFDAAGNVYIDAPGYRVEADAQQKSAPVGASSAPKSATPTTPGRRYWLVVNTAHTGIYKVLIAANGSPVAEIDPNRRQYVVDVTDKLQPGANRIEVTYLPIPGAALTAGDVSDVMVGLGKTAPDGTLTISRVLATHRQPAGRRSAEAINLGFTLK